MTVLRINPNRKLSKIHREIYGHFSEHLGRCIYGGIYVGEDSPIPNVNGMRTDVVEALKQIRIPVLRWPGGCFADEYHWMDGIGPKESRKKMINTHWGGVTEDNSFGTHEYFELCRQLGCEAYVNGNVGSGTVREMSEWVEYMTFGGVSPMAELRARNGHEKPWEVSFFGVGNENWGCGGNMVPEYYANEYRRYQTYVRSYGASGNQGRAIRRICCGPGEDDYAWTRRMMQSCTAFMDGLSLHHYTVPGSWGQRGTAADFDEKQWYRTLFAAHHMEELVTKHGAIMDEFDPEKRVALVVDEWGTWFDVEPGTNPGFLYQQNTVRDALVAGITLNIFNKHSDRVRMANLAQTVNVLQSVVLTDGADMLLTPTWHVFDLYKEHQEGTLVESGIDTERIGMEEEYAIPNLTESVSEAADGILHITLTNGSAGEAYPVEAVLAGAAAEEVRGEILHGGMADKNTFEAPGQVKAKPFEAVRMTETGFGFAIPPCSVLHLGVKLRR